LKELPNITKEATDQQSHAQLEELFSNSKTVNPSARLKAVYDFFPYMERELKKTGSPNN
jgi:hypothetical protein